MPAVQDSVLKWIEAHADKKNAVPYERYVGYIQYHVINDYTTSVTATYNQAIHDAPNDRTQIIIERQNGEPWNQVSELISNAIDAIVPGSCIGRFGIGFKQVLQELKTSDDAVIVMTKVADQSFARLVHFFKNDAGHIYLQDFQISIEEIAQIYDLSSPDDLPPSFTQMIVQHALTTTECDELQTYICNKYNRCFTVPIDVNETLINPTEAVLTIAATNVTFMAPDSRVAISIDVDGYTVSDCGPGMTDNILYRSLLNTRFSTKTSHPGGEALYYIPRQPDDTDPCIVKWVLSGATIEQFITQDPTLPKEVIIYLPQNTSISSGRQYVACDNTVLHGMQRLVDAICDSQNSSTCKIQWINGLIDSLSLVAKAGRLNSYQEKIAVSVFKEHIRSKIEIIVEKNIVYLPRSAGIQYLDMPDQKTVCLDPSIFPDILFEKIPGVQSIKALRPGTVTKRAYTAPFRARIHPTSNEPPYFTVGDTLIIDQTIYREACTNPVGIAGLNHVLHVHVGGPNESDIPREHLYFIDPEAYVPELTDTNANLDEQDCTDTLANIYIEESQPQSDLQQPITIQNSLIHPSDTFSPFPGRTENEGSDLEEKDVLIQETPTAVLNDVQKHDPAVIPDINRPLSKLAATIEMRGDTELRTEVYTSVHEDSSTVSTKQIADTIDFRKRPNAWIQESPPVQGQQNNDTYPENHTLLLEETIAVFKKQYDELKQLYLDKYDAPHGLKRFLNTMHQFLNALSTSHPATPTIVQLLTNFLKCAYDFFSTQTLNKTPLEILRLQDINDVLNQLKTITNPQTLALTTRNALTIVQGNYTNNIVHIEHMLRINLSYRPTDNARIGELSPHQLKMFIAHFTRRAADTRTLNISYELNRFYNFGTLLIHHGNFQMGDAIAHPSMVAAIYIYGEDFCKLKPGHLLTHDFIDALELTPSAQTECDYWFFFWLFAMHAGIDRIAETSAPLIFQAVLKNFITLYQTRNFFKFCSDTTMYTLRLYSTVRDGYSPSEIIQHMQQSPHPLYELHPLVCADHTLTNQQGQAIENFADLVKGHSKKSSLHAYMRKFLQQGNFGLQNAVFTSPLVQAAIYLYEPITIQQLQKIGIFEFLLSPPIMADALDTHWWLRFWQYLDTTMLNSSDLTSVLTRIKKYFTYCKHPLVQAAMDNFCVESFQCLARTDLFDRINPTEIDQESARLFWQKCCYIDQKSITPEKAPALANQISNAYQLFLVLGENRSTYRLLLDVNCTTTTTLTAAQARYIVQHLLPIASTHDQLFLNPQYTINHFITHGNFGLSDQIFNNACVQTFLFRYRNHPLATLLIANKLPEILAAHESLSPQQAADFWSHCYPIAERMTNPAEILALLTQIHNALTLFIASPDSFSQNWVLMLNVKYPATGLDRADTVRNGHPTSEGLLFAHALSKPQIQAITAFITQETSARNKQNFITLLIRYGNLGLGGKSKLLMQPHLLQFLYVSSHSFPEALTHCIEQGYLNSEWLSRLDVFKNKPLAWWDRSFNRFFWDWLGNTQDSAQFYFITTNYLAFIAQDELIYPRYFKPLDTIRCPHQKQNKSTMLHQAYAHQILQFAVNNALDKDKKYSLLNYFLHFGNFQLPHRLNDGLLWGLVTAPEAVSTWYSQDFITPTMLDKFPPVSQEKITAFWTFLKKIAPHPKNPTQFQSIFARCFVLCIESTLFDQELVEIIHYDNYIRFDNIQPNLKTSAVFATIKNLLLREDTCMLPHALPHIAEYFIALGNFLPQRWHTQRNFRIGIATLGARLGWYAKDEAILAKILAMIPEEETLHRDSPWIAQFWQFFSYLQQYQPMYFLKTPLFDQYLLCWKSLCQFDEELPSALLGYLHNPQQAQAFFSHTVSTSQDAKFNQLCHFFHAENFAAIEMRPTPSQPDFGVFSEDNSARVLQDTSLAEWMICRNGVAITQDTPLNTIEQTIKTLREQEQPRILIHEKQRFIQSVIASQTGQSHLWLRELIQNSFDALRKEKILHPEHSRAFDIDIEQYCYDNPQDGYDFVILIRDSAGMSFYDIANYLLIPGSSDPEKQKLQLLGLFGMGFYTIFQDTDIVEIKSSTGDNTRCELRIIVDRDGPTITPHIEYFQMIPNPEHFKGTEVRRIKTYAKNNALQAHLQGLSIAHQINYFVGGLLAPTFTVQADTAIPLPQEKPITITYNGFPVEQPKRELLAQVPIQGLGTHPGAIGFLQMYRQAHLATNRVEHAGLFVSHLGYPWTSLVPTVLHQEVGDGIVIVLPAGTQLTSDRSGIAKTQSPILLKAMFVLYTQALINLCVQHNHIIKTLPRDFYRNSQSSYAKIDQEVTDVCHIINLALDEQNTGAGYADWDDLLEEDILKFLHNRLLTIQLLTLIDENKLGAGFNLTNIITKNLDAIPISLQFKQMLQDQAAQIDNSKTVTIQPIPVSAWDAPQNIFAALITEIYRRTGIGFPTVVYYDNENSNIIAFVRSDSGILIKIGDEEDIIYPVFINVGNSVYKKRAKTLLAHDYPGLIFDENAENFIRTIAHEAAHTLEYKHELHKAFHIIDQHAWKHPHTLPAPLIQDLKHAIRCHFIAPKVQESEFYTRLAEIKSDYSHVPGINDVRDALSLWATNHTSYEETCCWTHNKDEALETSFINRMKIVLYTWLRCKIFIDFPNMLDKLVQQYPCEESMPDLWEDRDDDTLEIIKDPDRASPTSPSLASNGAAFFSASPETPAPQPQEQPAQITSGYVPIPWKTPNLG